MFELQNKHVVAFSDYLKLHYPEVEISWFSHTKQLTRP